MSEIVKSEPISEEVEKPVQNDEKPVQSGDVKFPPFPDPSDHDFDEDISEEERDYYKNKFPDINAVKALKLHCTACDRHLGCAPRNEARMRSHPMLRTLVCNTCHTFYNSGEFDKGEDGSELYCRWCGQGGQVYCCSDCPHVFCAKCIKRSLGLPKIKEIENTDDWKCFKCNNKCLWDLRAVCWALLRYCDQKNKLAYSTLDPILKDAYQKDCAVDYSECCKSKITRRKEKEARRKEAAEHSARRAATHSAIAKIPPTIQVKKFASISMEDSPKQEKKAQKRPASPKNKPTFMKSPLPISAPPGPKLINSAPPGPKLINPLTLPPLAKKMRMSSPSMLKIGNPTMMNAPRSTYARIRPKPPMHLMNNQFNGIHNPGLYNNMVINDNINLSLESLTQGLDMASVAAMNMNMNMNMNNNMNMNTNMNMNNNPTNDDVVCTPDFPLEPLCEVTEDNDDDVQCITPAPVPAPKVNIPTPPPLVPRTGNTLLYDLGADNIIQMTENDVTVNAATGGLKFRVDPQTLSSNKMYRLPDGRIFAINANPNMPGGYSATIVAVTEAASGKVAPKVAPKGATYAAKLSAVTTSQAPSTPVLKKSLSQPARASTSKRRSLRSSKAAKVTETPTRECDLNVPVEWYRYNLIDAVDALDYSMSRLQKLKDEATTMYLRTRTISEMRLLHKNLERLLNTSSNRFKEIRENLNKDLKQYLTKKMANNNNVSDDDDDDVEILNDLADASTATNANVDDPIFIDENSLGSNEANETDSQVDLTGVASSEHNDSGEKSLDQNNSFDKDPLGVIDQTIESVTNENGNVSADDDTNVIDKQQDIDKTECDETKDDETKDDEIEDDTGIHAKIKEDNQISKSDQTADEIDGDTEQVSQKPDKSIEGEETITDDDKTTEDKESNSSEVITKDSEMKSNDSDEEIADDKIQDSEVSEGKTVDSKDKEYLEDVEMIEDKAQDTDMTEELIETLLKDDDIDKDNAQNLDCLDIPEEFRET